MTRAFAAALLLLCAAASVQAAQRIEGRVVAVHDGDTITILDHSRAEHRIRLSQIDAPELGHGKNDPGQPFGQRARQSLSDLVYGLDVRAECETTDRYGRHVCTVWTGPLNVNLEQVRRGMAWVYRKYANNPEYARAEASARQSRRGLWADHGPVPPWEWRKAANDGTGVVCAMDTKPCQDGSWVSKRPPRCEFAPCPR
ncbi:thermonuclease family protein [Pelomicrobium methylotrophicum]|nr:thermonuclease family protein [Pelomicrobium methylotrophicum]